MLYSGVLIFGMFLPPSFLGAAAGLTALPASSVQGPIVPALALHVGPLTNDRNRLETLDAAWDFYRRNDPDNMELAYARFLGFLEGHTHLQVPLWWEEELAGWFLGPASAPEFRRRYYASRSLENREHVRSFNIVAPRQEKGLQCAPGTHYSFVLFAPKENQAEIKVVVPKEITIEVAGQAVIVRKGDDSVQIDQLTLKRLLAKNRTRFYKLSASFSAEYAYVSVFAAAKYASYPVVCIDRNKREIAWESLVEAFDEETRRLWFGPRWQRNSLAESRETIGVFGACLLGCYFEGFDKRTGKNVFRFSTSYWYHFP